MCAAPDNQVWSSLYFMFLCYEPHFGTTIRISTINVIDLFKNMMYDDLTLLRLIDK